MYEVWNLAQRKFAPLSRLYSLQPMGVGTSRVEGLSSYVMRLAEAHTVSVRVLIHREIFPKLPSSPKDAQFARVHSLNGMGACFEQWVNVLGTLTGRGDLRALTLLPWRGLLTCGGILRQHRAWCPRCLQEGRQSTMPVYECLLWMLTPVTACPIHEVLLEHRCPHCRRDIFLLSAHARPGYCAHCNRWLGDNEPAPVHCGCNQPSEDQLWIAREVGELLARAGTASEISSPRYLLSNLQRAISDLANGNRRLFERAAKIGSSLLMRWIHGDFFPSLSLIIRISHNLRLPLGRLVVEDIPSADPVWIPAKQAVQALFIARRRAPTVRPQYAITRVVNLLLLSLEERETARGEIKASLLANLELDEPRSIDAVFHNLGYRTPARGRKWFPDLCAATKAKRKQRVELYRQELRSALSEEPPPTVAEVALRLGLSIPQLRLRRGCRELCMALCARYPDRRRFQKRQTEEKLKRALEEPPIPLVILAANLGKNPNALRVAFPALCRRLRTRYVAHRVQEQQTVAVVYENAVSQAIDEIVDAGGYPSQQRVLSFISERNPSLTSFYLTGIAIKNARMKLGHQFERASRKQIAGHR